MPRKPIKFELDFMIKDIFPRFTVKQFDDVSFNIKPLNQGLDYDTSNMIGKIFVGVNNDMFMQTTGITVSSDNINVLLDKNMLQKNGRAYAEIELTDEAGTITSSSFIFDIDPKIGEGGMIPGEYEGFVEKYERLISEFKAQINSSIDNSNNLIDKTIKNCNTSVDTKLSTVDSRLNSKVAEVDNKLNTVDSLVNTKITNINNTLNKKVSEVDSKLDTVDGLITAKVSDFERRFSALTSSQQQNSEVIDAREGEVSLKARLDKDIENPKKLYASIEGTEISVDSLEGYLKDIEILGNTVQDQDNLADIRSVGDKLENQELYEIPVLSRGKNILNVNRMELGHINWINGLDIPDNNRLRSSFISIPSQAKALFATNEYGLSVIKGIVYYDKNKTYISCQTDDSSFTVPDTAKYIRVILEISADTDICISNEEVYEPYIEDKLTILSPVQLEKVGDVVDRIICKDGVWGVEKNINTLKITENEDWHMNYGSLTAETRINTRQFYIDSYDNLNLRNENKPICNKFNYGEPVYEEDIEGIEFIPYGSYCLRIGHTSKSVDEFKEWLRVNDVFVKYPDAQPTFIPLPHDQQIKLRTFANKTNISFGCEIEPTLKASVPKSIGASVNTHSEQIDNLGKELERVKKLEESTALTVTTESDFTTVEATSNGYFDDVKLEGRTLVNLNDIPSGFVVNGAGTICHIANGGKYLHNIKPNTIYTFIVHGMNSKFNNRYIIPGMMEGTSGLINGVGMFRSISVIDYSSGRDPHIYGSGITNEDITNLKLVILEGDHTQNPPSFFEGLKSVGQDVDEISVLSINENLFDETQHLPCGLSIDKMIFGQNFRSYYIKCEPNTSYYVRSNCSGNRFAVASNDFIQYDTEFTVNKVYNHNSPANEYNDEYTIFTTGQNDRYLFVYVTNNGVFNPPIIHIEKSSVIEEYKKPQLNKKRILYYNDETQSWEKPILRAFDSIEKHSDNKYYYHVRSEEVPYAEGDETKVDHITDMTTTVKKISTEKVYECTNLDLITYQNETNLIFKSGVLNPKVTLKVKKGIGNVVTMLQNKVAMLEDLVNKLIQK